MPESEVKSAIEHSVLFAALLLLAASCGQEIRHTRATIPLVERIVSDKSCTEFHILTEQSGDHAEGCISIIGDSSIVNRLSNVLTVMDMRDNITGASGSDSLPDFAGERFVSISDSIHTLLAASGDWENSRNRAVNLALKAIDRSYSVSMYDTLGSGRKEKAKIIILADPTYSLLGKFDIDTLFYMTGCRTEVLSPFELMVDDVFKGNPQGLNVGIIHDSLFLSKLCEEAFLSYAPQGSDCFCLPYGMKGATSLCSFIEKYAETRRVRPLDAIMIDNLDIDICMMEEELSRIRDVSYKESMYFGKYITPSFHIVDGRYTITRVCYDHMRKSNIFTHKIAFPLSEAFKATNSLLDSTELKLIPQSYVQD